MPADFSTFGSMSLQKYREPRGEPVCVRVFEKTLSAGKLIEFGDPVRSVIDYSE